MNGNNSQKASIELSREALCDEMDGYLVTKDVVALVRMSKRQIDRLIAQQKFPKADVPGLNGAPSRWRRSTIKRALDDMQTTANAKSESNMERSGK